jgi:hypothetical protein
MGVAVVVAFASTGKRKTVRRLDVCLDAEPRLGFARRLAAALRAREAAKAASVK